jgi:trypsin-like peptidase/tetratricopeptide repeat protein
LSASVAALVQGLKTAADEFDEATAEAICEELRQGILGQTLKPSDDEQKAVMKQLRRCRWFSRMQRFGEALGEQGLACWTARRQLGQALIEQGDFDKALGVVEALVADPQCPPGEVAEARGLEGRLYKQRYMDRGAALTGGARRQILKSCIDAYYPVYATNGGNYWHGINTVAMLLRGRRDGNAIDVGKDPLDLAQEIVDGVETAKKKEHWDIASAAEACVALGKWPQALSYMTEYVGHPDLDSFSAASTLRQFEQVWQLGWDGPGRDLILLLRLAVVGRTRVDATAAPERMHAALSLPLKDLLAFEAVARERRSSLEKKFGPQGPRLFTWIEKCAVRARSVGRIERLTGEGFGTGFLVPADLLYPSLKGSNELLLVTNSHVLGTKDDEALRPQECRVRFEALGEPRTFRVKKLLFESPELELDVTVAQLDPAVSGADLYSLAPDEEPTFDPKVTRKLNVIGHPKGGLLSISIDDNLQVGWRHPRLHYRTPTEGGSSGSPVFDDEWNLIAVHHAGSEKMTRLDQAGTYQANEGIWIHAIRQAIAEDAATRRTG